jgi:hypothetical protein
MGDTLLNAALGSNMNAANARQARKSKNRVYDTKIVAGPQDADSRCRGGQPVHLLPRSDDRRKMFGTIFAFAGRS